MAFLSRLRAFATKPRLDPGRFERVRQRYEVDAGYAEYHAFCRSRFQREIAPGQEPLRDQGRELLRILDESRAREIAREIEARFPRHPTAEKSPHLSQFQVDDARFGRDLLERIVTSEVDGRVAGFFGSEFLVYWFTITRATPLPEVGFNSFRWHCDRGPVAHVKLLLYLNGYTEHGGGTEFLDLDATRRISASGYVYAPVKTRQSDLTRIAERHGARYAPWSPEIQAGEGILFQPASVLHRGLLPTRGPRYVVTVCLLPSPIPWRDAADRGGLDWMQEEEKWHEPAEQLRAALAP
jgi:hypothetical protein